MIEKKIINCTCSDCVKQCKFRPGWFSYSQLSIVASYLNVSEEELFLNYLAIDWWEKDDGKVIYIIAPALKDTQTGIEYPKYPTGECVFYSKGQCLIYPVRPLECQTFDHTLTQETYRIYREKLALDWEDKFPFIEKLLGRSPQAKECNFIDIIKHFF